MVDRRGGSSVLPRVPERISFTEVRLSTFATAPLTQGTSLIERNLPFIEINLERQRAAPSGKIGLSSLAIMRVYASPKESRRLQRSLLQRRAREICRLEKLRRTPLFSRS